MVEEINTGVDRKGWVIIYTASNSHFAGKVIADNNGKVTLNPAFNWINESAMPAPGQMMLIRQPTPLAPTLEASMLEIDYIGKQSIDEWDEDTKEEFFKQIDGLVDGMKAAKRQRDLQKSNIVIPKRNIDPRLFQDLKDLK
jgi:hypothetical protein